MKPPPLQRHVARFDQRNDFVCAVLGASRLGRAYVEFVEHETKGREPTKAGPSTESDYVLLGLYAVARTVGELTDAWSVPSPGSEEPTAAPRPTQVGLLR